jgi:hypothetical protein
MSDEVRETLDVVGKSLVGLCMCELTDNEMTIYRALAKMKILTTDENDEIKKAA